MQSQVRDWRLAPHVHACRSEDQVVLLDLLQDKYLAVGGAQSSALTRVVEGWPAGHGADGSSIQGTSLADPGAIARRLMQRGLLTKQARPHERLPVVTLQEATATLGEVEAAEAVRVGPRCLFQFLQSASAAALALRGRSLLAVARAVAARRAAFDLHPQPFPIEQARRAVAAYERLRPLLFTSRDKCLFDSLALANFLACQGLFPRWVIGVKTGPFGAHAWVQSEHMVLNDLHERVRRYTPILVV
jgi:hypothetical protein